MKLGDTVRCTDPGPYFAEIQPGRHYRVKQSWLGLLVELVGDFSRYYLCRRFTKINA